MTFEQKYLLQNIYTGSIFFMLQFFVHFRRSFREIERRWEIYVPTFGFNIGYKWVIYLFILKNNGHMQTYPR